MIVINCLLLLFVILMVIFMVNLFITD